MLELFLCMILDINNGASLVASCRSPYDEQQTINKINLQVVGIEVPTNKQLFTEESKQNLAKLCLNKEAEVSIYTQNDQLIIGEIECDGKNAAKYQLSAGLAKVNLEYLDEDESTILLKYQQKAQQQNIGIWNNTAQ